mgnify:CR=1 FL=1
MINLHDLVELHHLKRIAEGNGRPFDVSQVEEDFLAFSNYTPRKALHVKLPKLYAVAGDKTTQLLSALQTLGIQPDAPPSAIDISGAFDPAIRSDAILFLSPQQYEADHSSSARSSLDPLLEKIYTEGVSLLRDFTLHEALIGRVQALRGTLALDEVRLFPDRFVSGPYQLSVELDTPDQTVSHFRALASTFTHLHQDPSHFLLDPQKVEEVTQKTIALRRKLGSLSRYETPTTQTFQASVDHCVVRTPSNTLFYLYLPNSNHNILVYFGEPPFDNLPSNLTVFSGHEHQTTLLSLAELGVYEASSAILEQRINALTQLCDNASRGLRQPLEETYPHIQHLLSTLQDIYEPFQHMANPEIRTNYAIKQAPELLEFMICPASSSPTVHELLPRLSWNDALRTYHNPRKFIPLFQRAGEETQRAFLRQLSSSIHFNNQQNQDVNLWLYRNHANVCQEEGLEFNVY